MEENQQTQQETQIPTAQTTPPIEDTPNILPGTPEAQSSPPDEKPKSKLSKILIPVLLIIVVVILGLVVYLFIQNQQLKEEVSETLQPTVSQENLSPTPATDPTADWKTYKDNVAGFEFKYPDNNWSVNTQVISKGETLQEEGYQDIVADEGEIKVISLTSVDLQIQISAQNEYTSDKCGGTGPNEDEGQFHKIDILGREAMRMDLENGSYWAGGSRPENLPHPQPIMFKRLPSELTNTFPNEDTDSSYVIKWCIEDENIPIRLMFTYYSDQFLNANFENEQIDIATLSEADQILSTFKFLDNATFDWETYTNNDEGFSFKYPTDWTETGPVAETDTTLVYITSDESFGTGPEPIRYFIYVQKTNTLPDFDFEQVDLIGYTTYKTDQVLSRSGSLSYFTTEDETSYISLSLSPYQANSPFFWQDRFSDIFTQILSTFTFLD